MLDLSNVTLVSIDSVIDHHSKSNIRLAAISRIVPEVLKQIYFGDILMINPFGKNKDLLNIKFEPHWKDFDLEKNPKNIGWLNNYLIKVLPKLIKTEWYLIIQWDGFPVNINKWTNEFFEYPFLGGGHSVYNGGFSLRNTDVMRKISEINDVYETGSEDCFYSCFLDNEWSANKKTPFKIKWAVENIVNNFCFWNSKQSEQNSFGWHRYNSLSKSDINSMFKKLSIFSSKEVVILTDYCLIKEMEYQNFNVIKNFDLWFNDEFFNNY